jgi:hypothetical protein
VGAASGMDGPSWFLGAAIGRGFASGYHGLAALPKRETTPQVFCLKALPGTLP